MKALIIRKPPRKLIAVIIYIILLSSHKVTHLLFIKYIEERVML